MSSPSGTTLLVLGVATQAQLILPSTAAFWQTVTAIGLTLTPLLARVGQNAARRLERRLGTEDLEVVTDPEGPGTVVIGFGRVGRIVTDMLERHGRKYVAVEADIDATSAARRAGHPVVFGDASRAELIDRLNLGRADALILTMDDPVLSVRLTRRDRKSTRLNSSH